MYECIHMYVYTWNNWTIWSFGLLGTPHQRTSWRGQWWWDQSQGGTFGKRGLIGMGFVVTRFRCCVFLFVNQTDKEWTRSSGKCVSGKWSMIFTGMGILEVQSAVARGSPRSRTASSLRRSQSPIGLRGHQQCRACRQGGLAFWKDKAPWLQFDALESQGSLAAQV